MTDSGSGSSTNNIERRRFLRQAATVAWATPTILTLMSSRAGAQVGPVQPCGRDLGGGNCENDPPCASPLPQCQTDPQSLTGECACFAI
jgi:hypothetical protein